MGQKEKTEKMRGFLWAILGILGVFLLGVSISILHGMTNASVVNDDGTSNYDVFLRELFSVILLIVSIPMSVEGCVRNINYLPKLIMLMKYVDKKFY